MHDSHPPSRLDLSSGRHCQFLYNSSAAGARSVLPPPSINFGLLARMTDPEEIFDLQRKAVTKHVLVRGDGRDLRWLPDASVHLVLTSPPYWNIQDYGKHRAQLG